MPADTLQLLHSVYTGRPTPVLAESGGVEDLLLPLVILAAIFLPRGWKEFRRYRLHRNALEKLDVNFARYDEWLAGSNSYYKSLDITLRKRFLLRVTEFMKYKKFQYVDVEADEKMPLFISAAAIQLTFGLDKYLLDFFDTIYVLKHDYTYGMYNTPFAGHVSRNGIYLSWNNFLRGYSDDSDGDNVGIHEMAHALAYVNFMAEDSDSEDDEFKQRFRTFSLVARPIFENMQQGGSTILDNYAATNYNEFWAVSVETFFEKSLSMKVHMPELYNALCTLLRQDPLLEGKVDAQILA